MSLTFPKTILLLSAAWALCTLWIFPFQSGLLTVLLDLRKPGTLLPGSNSVPGRHHYTGVKVIDDQLLTMVGLFWPALDGSRVDISLVALELLSQFMAAWVLIMIESLWLGNRGKWYITSVTITGLLIQNFGIALVTPLWMYLHLTYSATATADPSSVSPFTLSNPLSLLTLPLSTFVALVAPNILMSLSPPHPLSPTNSTKQFYTALAQFWPVYLTAAQTIFTILISVAVPGINALSEADKKRKSLRYVRRAYTFALLVATCSHLIVVGIPLLAYFFPALLNPAYTARVLQPSNVFVPVADPPRVRQIEDVADGILALFQWDLYIGSFSVLVWAVTLRVRAQGRPFWLFEWMEGLLTVGMLTAVSGPCGAAVAVMWERDEHVFERDRKRETGREKERERKRP